MVAAYINKSSKSHNSKGDFYCIMWYQLLTMRMVTCMFDETSP